jgi:tetratricopeptide (TPR) repeat protein
MDTIQKIPLRMFYKKIEELIMDQQSDAAISQAEYLLEKYPKNISVYKLLGKAFLETQEFDYANTVFEKILLVEPDDFVSLIGISIIAESFGNLEKSLDSMRRAYELEPSNESLQTEVKRLHEAKDGFAPDQVRLTRGALIKMYSRSQLTEQAIAEARLGIQESPNRIDYKVHLANMFFQSSMNIKAIEICLDIVSILPYCKPALIILYKSITPLGKIDESTVYKTRLTEIDPYFSFIKPDTESVEYIPDIAIMVEEREKPTNPLGNLNDFIEEAWKETSRGNDLPPSEEQIEDWTSIINNAVSNDSIGAPITNTSYEEVILPSDIEDNIEEMNQQIHPTLITKKDKLRKKLSTAQKTTREEEIIIPEWVFEDSLADKTIEDNNDLSERPIITDKALQKDSYNDPALENSYPHFFESNGMADHNRPINPPTDSSDLKISPTWVNEQLERETNNMQKAANSLDETQKIMVLPGNPDELITQAFKSVDEGNIEFANLCLNKVIHNNYKLEEFAIQLEDACRLNPSEIDLWFTLVEVYKKLGFIKKSLETLEEAQHNLLF